MGNYWCLTLLGASCINKALRKIHWSGYEDLGSVSYVVCLPHDYSFLDELPKLFVCVSSVVLITIRPYMFVPISLMGSGCKAEQLGMVIPVQYLHFL